VTPDDVMQRLAQLEGACKPSRYLVAYSGGLDSTVLLHALHQVGARAVPLVAVHVNHGLQPDAAAWEQHCARFAERLGVRYESRSIKIAASDPRGVEAAAREQRYQVLAELVRPGDHVLTAHHEEDQAETLLLNLMRGSGTAGLAGIGARQPFGEGLLLRPLLGVPRREIEAYAAAHALEWCDDPSNADSGFDRNFLRREILPALRRRWPAVSARLARSAELLAEANALLGELAALDLAVLGSDPARLDLEGLRRLSRGRQRNVLRHAIRQLGLAGAPSTRLEQAVRELLPARPDAQPLVRWPGGEFRRYRGTLYILPPLEYGLPAGTLVLPADGRPLPLGNALGSLQLERAAAGGIDPQLVGDGLRVSFRAGGEVLRPAGRGHTQPVKKLLQEQGVLPWMREFVPLLYADRKLVAVADLWVAEEAVCAEGYRVRWVDRPPLF
jgi:tRNA(Ile)-lysidine synthase